MASTLTREIVKNELNNIPDNLLGDIYEYLKYLKYKINKKTDSGEIAHASEKSLSKDWNRKEEDQAWGNL